LAKKKKKKITRNDLDKMSFEKREKVRKKLREEAVYTRSFKTPQSFGAASKCVSLSIEEYLSYSPNPEIVRIIKNEDR
jgi:hypothetical protein